MEGRSRGVSFQRVITEIVNHMISHESLEKRKKKTSALEIKQVSLEDDSPSRKDVIDLRKETCLRKLYFSFLHDLGMKLKVCLYAFTRPVLLFTWHSTGVNQTMIVLIVVKVFPVTPKLYHPVAGMMIGNAMTVTVTMKRLRNDVKSQMNMVEAILALGGTPHYATLEQIKRSLVIALSPVLDITKTVGLLLLPSYNGISLTYRDHSVADSSGEHV